MVKARIEQPLNIPCLLDIKKLLHLAWYRCTTVEECRTDWVKHRIAHIEEMRDVYDDYPDRYGVKLNGTLTINKILPEDDGKIYICLGKIQFSGMVENITVVKIIEGMILQKC